MNSISTHRTKHFLPVSDKNFEFGSKFLSWRHCQTDRLKFGLEKIKLSGVISDSIKSKAPRKSWLPLKARAFDVQAQRLWKIRTFYNELWKGSLKKFRQKSIFAWVKATSSRRTSRIATMFFYTLLTTTQTLSWFTCFTWNSPWADNWKCLTSL